MNVENFKSINAELNEISGKNKKGQIFIDNLHSPYIKFDQKYVLPSSYVTNPDVDQIKSFVKILMEFVPEALEGTCILPEPRPRRETNKLFFVRPMLFNQFHFMYVFSVDMQYLGGATTEEIKKPATQNLTPSVVTDRIYFQIKVVLLDNLIQDGDHVIDFTAKRFQGGEFRIETERGDGKPVRKFSEIFDEIDFSETEQTIREELGITKDIWKLGRVYSPIGIDYLSLSMRFLNPSLADTVHLFHDFYPLLTQGQSLISEKTLELYHTYLSKHDVERTQSKSGNMLWRLWIQK